MKKQSSAIVDILLMILCLSLSSELYAEAILYGSDTDLQKLYTIDTTNASAIEVGSFGVAGYMAGLAYDADNDIMYGTTTGTNKLYSIDYTTGGATFIGDLGVTLMHGLAYDNSSDMLFGAFGMKEGDGLYQIDVSTGNSTLIGNIGHFYDDYRNTVDGLAVHPITNDLYGVIGGPSDVSALVRINKTTGSGTFLHEYSSIFNMSGLAFLPDGTLYATDNWSGNLYTLDIFSGSTQLIGNTGFGNALGLTCVYEIAKFPSADLTGNCFVNYEDFALLANQWPAGYNYNDLADMATQWLTGYPNIPDDMAYISGGEFEMGDHFAEGKPDELLLHAVLINAFFMGKFEITNQQYCDYLNYSYDACDIKVDGGIVYALSDNSNSYPYCDTNSSNTWSQINYSGSSFSIRTKGGRDMSNDPMIEVSWYGAVAYCNWRSSEEGYESCYNLSTWDCNFSKHGYRLPSEAEWEYAARGGEHSPYCRFPWGDTITHSQANYDSDAFWPYDVSPTRGYHPAYNDGIWPCTAPVGSFPANGYGLYDMTGNVWEWCNDWYYSDYYDTSPYDNPTGPASGSGRVLRGGGWIGNAFSCRVADRGTFPGVPDCYYGFRVVLDLELRLPGQASNPSPSNGSSIGNLDFDLSWTAGLYSTSHDVYFGTSNPPSFIKNQTDTTYDPGTMDSLTKYYWRIDERNPAGKTTGVVWNFTTMTPPPPPP